MSLEAHPLELAVALGLLAPLALEREEPHAKPSDEELAQTRAAFDALCARLDDEASFS